MLKRFGRDGYYCIIMLQNCISFSRFHWGAHCCWYFVLVLSQVAMLVLQPFNVLLLFNVNVTLS